MFDPRKQELKDIKHKAHIACQKFNAMDEYDPQRSRVIGEILGKTGKVYYFQGPVQFNYGCHTFIGENFFANFNLTVMDDGPIYIGDNVLLRSQCVPYGHQPPAHRSGAGCGLDEQGRTTMAEFAEEIRVGNNVWIACNATVIGGVTIGDNVVIGAGSVVTKDLSEPAIWPTAIRPARCVPSPKPTARST